MPGQQVLRHQPLMSPAGPGMAARIRGPMEESELSAVEPHDECIEDSIPGFLVLASAVLVLIGLKKFRSFQRPVRQLQEPLMRL